MNDLHAVVLDTDGVLLATADRHPVANREDDPHTRGALRAHGALRVLPGLGGLPAALAGDRP